MNILKFFNKKKYKEGEDNKNIFIDLELAKDNRGYYSKLYDYTPYFDDKLLKEKKLEIYNEMMLDSEIEGAINTLKTLRLSKGFKILPGSNEERDKEIAEFIQFNFENLEGSFYDDLREIMGALELGISICEINYKYCDNEKYKNKIVLKSIKSKNPKNFNLITDEYGNLLDYGIVNISNIDFKTKYPTDKFIIYSFNKKYENIFGSSRLRSIYALWFLKQVLIKSLGIFVEKFGHPFPVIKHPATISETTRKYLLELIKQIRIETGFLLPEGLDISFADSSKASGDFILRTIDKINESIRKTILGQTLTTETKGVGSYALGKVHFDILTFYIEQLGLDIAEKAINLQLIKRLVDYNYDNVINYPKFVFNSLIEEDIQIILSQYYQGVSAGIIKPIPEDEIKIREILKFPTKSIDKVKEDNFKEVTEDNFKEFTSKFKENIFTGVKRRSFTVYEEDVIDFIEIKSDMNNDLIKYATKIGEIVKKSLQEILKDIQRKRIIEDKKFDEVNKIIFPGTGDIKQIFFDLLIKSNENGKKQARRELINKRKKIKTKVKKYSEVLLKLQDENLLDLRKLTPEEALKYYEAKAFSMAGVEKDYILNKVKNILYNGIKQGIPLKNLVDSIQSELEVYFLVGKVEDEAMAGYRIETVVRTNITEAMNEGRKQFFEDPTLDNYVQAYQYSAILDDRTTDICTELDGRIYGVNSDVIDTITPPNHFNCRSLLVPVVAGEEWEESPSLPKKILDLIYNFKKI